MLLLTINPKEKEPADYTDRKTSKAVIVNNAGEVFSFPSILIGGGVEGNETFEEALHREALEEAGVKIEIEKYLGEVIGYRDALKQKYIIKGYVCKYIDKVAEPIDELHHKPQWIHHVDLVNRIKKEIHEIKIAGVKDGEDPDYFQARIGNREMMICLVEEAFKK